jgi:hypothetical protein
MAHNLQPLLLVFGARQIATSAGRRWLYNGTVNATAVTTPLDVPTGRRRHISRMVVNQRTGGAGAAGIELTYRVLVNNANTSAFVTFPIGSSGSQAVILPAGGEILVPDDGLVAVVVDKTANITSSPLDISVSVELI